MPLRLLLDENVRGLLFRELIDHLVLVCHASDSSEWEDQMRFIP